MKGLFIYLFFSAGVLLVSLAPNTLVRWIKPDFETQTRKGKRLHSILCAGYLKFFCLFQIPSHLQPAANYRSQTEATNGPFLLHVCFSFWFMSLAFASSSDTYMLLTGREVRIGKTVSEALSTAWGRRQRAVLKTWASVLFLCGPTVTG